jgi:hypothetical protein
MTQAAAWQQAGALEKHDSPYYPALVRERFTNSIGALAVGRINAEYFCDIVIEPYDQCGSAGILSREPICTKCRFGWSWVCRFASLLSAVSWIGSVTYSIGESCRGTC